LGAQLPPGQAFFARSWGVAGSGKGQLDGMVGACQDDAGFVYTGHQSRQAVQKFSPSGQLQWIVADPQLGLINSVAFDGKQTIWVASNGVPVLAAVSKSGKIKGSWDRAALGYATAAYICCDLVGRVWLSDLSATIYRFNPSLGAVDQVVPFTTGVGLGQFATIPTGMAVDPGTGFLHVIDIAGGRVNVWDPATQAWQTSWTLTGAGNSAHISIDPRFRYRHVQLWDTGTTETIGAFTDTGTAAFTYGSRGSGNGQFNSILSVDATIPGQVVVADVSLARITVFNITPSPSSGATGPTGPAGSQGPQGFQGAVGSQG
ncbi:MAG: hypothetical protein JSS40_08365, partial [Proteobacteria bacterium]|nr:hypothetical protein [Pseudomonadota bacterium]